ncbi:MAG: hypothetical protein NTW44_07800 [Nitrospirae bacterium]|nr:hypothetical protein [Nitrospirota bacterium]
MRKLFTKEELKTYAYLYLMTAPFTYLVSKLGGIYGRRDDETWLFLNIFITLSIWLYIRKIRPLLNIESGSNKANILLFLLITTVAFLSIKSVSHISRLESDISSMEYDMSELKTDLSNIESDLKSLTYRY